MPGMDYTPEFESLWKEYPKKVEKQTAFKEFNKAGLQDDDALRSRILTDVRLRKQSHAGWRQGKKFIKALGRYIRDGNYDDEIIREREQGHTELLSDVPSQNIDPHTTDEQILAYLVEPFSLTDIAIRSKSHPDRVRKLFIAHRDDIVRARISEGQSRDGIFLHLVSPWIGSDKYASALEYIRNLEE
jgi:hypothetical protein